MENIVVVGSINSDTTINVPSLPAAGETVLGRTVNHYFGGKGANQAVTIGRLKGNVTMLGKVGNDPEGKELINNLENNGVDISRIEVEENSLSGRAYICVNDAGENNIVVVPGANNKVDKDYIDKNIDLIKKSKICISQMEIPLETVEYLVDICYREGVKLILNPAPMQSIDKKVFSKVPILVPNKTELESIIGQTIETENIKLYEHDIKKIGSEIVITTLGKEGSFLVSEEENKLFSSRKVKVVDTTGAGDSFVGALGYKLSNGASVNDAIEFATVVSGITVTKKGSQEAIPTKENRLITNYNYSSNINIKSLEKENGQLKKLGGKRLEIAILKAFLKSKPTRENKVDIKNKWIEPGYIVVTVLKIVELSSST